MLYYKWMVRFQLTITYDCSVQTSILASTTNPDIPPFTNEMLQEDSAISQTEVNGSIEKGQST